MLFLTHALVLATCLGYTSGSTIVSVEKRVIESRAVVNGSCISGPDSSCVSLVGLCVTSIVTGKVSVRPLRCTVILTDTIGRIDIFLERQCLHRGGYMCRRESALFFHTAQRKELMIRHIDGFGAQCRLLRGYLQKAFGHRQPRLQQRRHPE